MRGEGNVQKSMMVWLVALYVDEIDRRVFFKISNRSTLMKSNNINFKFLFVLESSLLVLHF